MFADFQSVQITTGFVIVAIALLTPKVFYPISWILLTTGAILSLIIPKILLALVFYLIITPVAVLRRLTGRDNLKLKCFKEDKTSVFTERNKTIEPNDIINPY